MIEEDTPLSTAVEEELLSLATEECLEIGQRLSKARRFGLMQAQAGQPSNADRIRGEVCDLFGLLELLQVSLPAHVFLLPTEADRDAIEAKKIKTMRYIGAGKDPVKIARLDAFYAGEDVGIPHVEMPTRDPA